MLIIDRRDPDRFAGLLRLGELQVEPSFEARRIKGAAEGYLFLGPHWRIEAVDTAPLCAAATILIEEFDPGSA